MIKYFYVNSNFKNDTRFVDAPFHCSVIYKLAAHLFDIYAKYFTTCSMSAIV